VPRFTGRVRKDIPADHVQADRRTSLHVHGADVLARSEEVSAREPARRLFTSSSAGMREGCGSASNREESSTWSGARESF